MKYIMIEEEMKCGLKRYIPIIFPSELVHKNIAEHILYMMRFERNMKYKVISAGFYNMNNNRCYGESESLKRVPRPEDATIISTHDFLHGL